MPCLLNSPDSINRLFHSRQPGCVPHVGTGEKRLWGGRTRHESCHPTTFFRLSRLHTPLPRCLSFHSLMQLSGSYKKRCPRAFPMSGPTAVNRPRHGKGTRAYSRLTDINPYSAPVIRGHMCLACCTRPIAAITTSPKAIGASPYSLGVIRSCSYRSRSKKRCPRAFPMSGPTAVNRPRHRKGTRAYSRLTDINPYSAPVIRGHMCLAC